MSKMQKKNLSKPDEKCSFDKGQVDVAALGDASAGLEMVHLCNTYGENRQLSGAPSPVSCVRTFARGDGRWFARRVRAGNSGLAGIRPLRSRNMIITSP